MGQAATHNSLSLGRLTVYDSRNLLRRIYSVNQRRMAVSGHIETLPNSQALPGFEGHAKALGVFVKS